MSVDDHRADTAPAALTCNGCALVARREFLRNAALALVTLGVAPGLASAAPVSFVQPVARSREEATYPIPAADGTQIDKAHDAILTRWQGKIYAFSLACPHQNTTLKWSDKTRQFECPKHHSRFTPDGLYVKDSGRATRGLDRLPIRREGGTVVVKLDTAYQEDENAAEWTSAFITV